MADALTDGLDRLRHALRRGDYAALAALTRQIEQALPMANGLSSQALANLRADAERTAACLAAARSGLRAARRRLAEIRAGAGGLATYDSHGRIERAMPAATPAKRL